MINVLIVDDSNDKVVSIIKAIREQSDSIVVDVVVDSITAQKYLSNHRYDLLILDINLPLRENEEPSIEIGKNLLSEINRKTNLYSPYFIIGITQYGDQCSDVSNVWQVIHYSPELAEWKSPLINLIQHIIKTGIVETRTSNLTPTIFVEGKTDEVILKESIRLFKPEILDKMHLKSDRSAGASWVARQIIAWSASLKRDSNNYVKAVGVLDGDIAGKNAIDEVNRVVRIDSAESKTFKIFKLSPSYARHIITIKKKGLDLPITLEEMFDAEIWKFAQEQGWIEPRNHIDSLLANPSKWNKFEISLKDYIATIGLSPDEQLYLNYFKPECKQELVTYIMNMTEEKRKNALQSFEKVVIDVSDYFFPINMD